MLRWPLLAPSCPNGLHASNSAHLAAVQPSRLRRSECCGTAPRRDCDNGPAPCLSPSPSPCLYLSPSLCLCLCPSLALFPNPCRSLFPFPCPCPAPCPNPDLGPSGQGGAGAAGVGVQGALLPRLEEGAAAVGLHGGVHAPDGGLTHDPALCAPSPLHPARPPAREDAHQGPAGGGEAHALLHRAGAVQVPEGEEEAAKGRCCGPWVEPPVAAHQPACSMAKQFAELVQQVITLSYSCRDKISAVALTLSALSSALHTQPFATLS